MSFSLYYVNVDAFSLKKKANDCHLCNENTFNILYADRLSPKFTMVVFTF